MLSPLFSLLSLLPLLPLLLPGVAAQAAGAAAAAGATTSTLTPQAAALAVLALLAGLFVLFAGHRLFRPTLFLGGFVFAGALGYIVLARAEPATGYASRDSVLLLGSLAFALVGGLLAIFLWRLGLALIGAMGGVALAVFVLSCKTGGTIESETGRAVFLCVCAVAGSIAILVAEKPAIIVTTAVLGAYLVVFGIDVFAKTGVVTALKDFLAGPRRFDPDVFEVNAKVAALLATMVVLAVVGILVQFRVNKGRTFFHNVSKA
ncbi:hypothetical protein BC831DRAFT_478441 [Entophlyctis helioformis]|nr:hypothetical protein BC831DRAFT_478441 [Entophlyctis helioformis]